MGFLLSLQALDRAEDRLPDMQFLSTVSAGCVSTVSAVC